MSEFYTLLGVAWVVYLSETIWWVRERHVVLTGWTIGEFRAHYGPVLVMRRDQGIFCPRVVPPFTYSFALDPGAADGARSGTDRTSIADTARNAMAVAARSKLIGEVIWAYVFVGIPLVIAAFGFLRTWPVLLVVLLAMIVVALIAYRSAWSALHPGDPRGWISHGVIMAMSPLSTIRAADHLTRNALGAYAPILTVTTMAGRDDALGIARLAYFDSVAPEAPATFKPEDHALLAPLSAADVFAPPEQENAEMRGYCPRCHTQLTRTTGACPDCVTIQVLPFSDAPVIT